MLSNVVYDRSYLTIIESANPPANMSTMNRDLATGYSQNVDWIQPPMAEVNNSTSDTVARFRHEFHDILRRPANTVLNHSITDSSATTSDVTDTTMSEFLEGYMLDALSSDSIIHLHRIAEMMSSLGHLNECVYVYKSVRKAFVDTHFRRLMANNSAGELRIPFEDMKKNIDDWIKAARTCITHIFKHEKRVYDQIFQGIGTADTYEAGFIATVKDAYTELFQIADSLSYTGPPNPNKLFTILEFYDAVSYLNSDITYLFPPESVRSIKNNNGEILSRLHKVVEKMIHEFVKSLVYEVPRSDEHKSGPIHHSTEVVMTYISRVLKHKKTLNQLIVSNPFTGFNDVVIADMNFVTPRDGQTPLGMYMILIIVVLRFNLESKFKMSQQSGNALFHLFMMSNIHYIVQHIRGSPELREMIGDDYLGRLSRKVEEDMDAVEELLCKRMLECLKDEGVTRNTCFSNGVSKSVVRERIQLFNSKVEEVQNSGPSWVVREVQLREKLLNSILKNLIPRYHSFLDRYGSTVDTTRYPDVIKYKTEEELRSFIIKNFFA